MHVLKVGTGCSFLLVFGFLELRFKLVFQIYLIKKAQPCTETSILQLFAQFKEIENIFNVGVSFQFLIDQQSTEVEDIPTTAVLHIVTRETKSIYFNDNQFLLEDIHSNAPKLVVCAFCEAVDKSCDIIHKLRTLLKRFGRTSKNCSFRTKCMSSFTDTNAA